MNGKLLLPVPAGNKKRQKDARKRSVTSKQELFYRALFAQNAMGIVYISVDGRWLEANQRFCTLVAYAHDELLRHTCADLLHSEDHSSLIQSLQQMFAAHLITSTMELRFIRKDGGVIRLKLTVTPCEELVNAHYALIGFVEDVSMYEQTDNLSNLSAVPAVPDLAATQSVAIGDDWAAIDEQYEDQQQGMARVDKKAGYTLASSSGHMLDYQRGLSLRTILDVTSHELRTPLTTIKASTQLALRRLNALLQHAELPSAKVASKVEGISHMLERSERQIGVLNALVSNMIDLARLLNGNPDSSLSQEPCDLVSLVRDVVSEQQKGVPERTIDIDLPAAMDVCVYAHRERISQVLANYLSNALKYSAVDQPVTVQVQLKKLYTGESGVEISVIDRGVGLSPEDQQRVWDCLYRSPDVKVLYGSSSGLGVGLTICKVLVEKYRGQVGVSSQPSEGSRFWFTLPLIGDVSV